MFAWYWHTFLNMSLLVFVFQLSVGCQSRTLNSLADRYITQRSISSWPYAYGCPSHWQPWATAQWAAASGGGRAPDRRHRLPGAPTSPSSPTGQLCSTLLGEQMTNKRNRYHNQYLLQDYQYTAIIREILMSVNPEQVIFQKITLSFQAISE